jgi:hypothetical protein
VPYSSIERIIFSCESVPVENFMSKRVAAERPHGVGDLARHGLGRADVQGALGPDVVLEAHAAVRRPPALSADRVVHGLEALVRLFPGLLVGLGDVARRVDADRQLIAGRTSPMSGGRDRRTDGSGRPGRR